jgi:hypothetical protein
VIGKGTGVVIGKGTGVVIGKGTGVVIGKGTAGRVGRVVGRAGAGIPVVVAMGSAGGNDGSIGN